MKEPKTPLFITGNPRSGTTLMRLIFNNHSLIGIPDETNLLHWYFKRPAWQRLLNSKIGDNRVLVKAFGSAICSEFDAQPSAIRKDPKSGIEFLFNAFLNEEGKEYWGDKTPLQTQFLDQIWEMFPYAFVINMIRDPRAVVASAKRYFDKKRGPYDFWITRNIEETVARWKTEVSRSTEYESKRPDFMSRVYYEGLVENPQKVLAPVCQKMGIEFESQMLDYHQDRKSDKNKLTDWHLETTKPINKGNVDKWRTELTEDEINYIERELKDEMIAFGYLNQSV